MLSRLTARTPMRLTSLAPRATLLSLALLTALTLRATINSSLQMQLGNPSNATADSTNHNSYLLSRAQYALSFSDNNGDPNWVSWDLTTADIGSSGRSNFI